MVASTRCATYNAAGAFAGELVVLEGHDPAFDGCDVSVGALHQPAGATGEVVDDFGSAHREPVEVDDVEVGEHPRRDDAAVVQPVDPRRFGRLTPDHEFEGELFAA